MQGITGAEGGAALKPSTSLGRSSMKSVEDLLAAETHQVASK